MEHTATQKQNNKHHYGDPTTESMCILVASSDIEEARPGKPECAMTLIPWYTPTMGVVTPVTLKPDTDLMGPASPPTP